MWLCDKISALFDKAVKPEATTLFSKVHASHSNIGGTNYFWVQAVPVPTLTDAYIVTSINMNENGFLTGRDLGKDGYRLDGRSPWMTRAEAERVIESHEKQCAEISSYKEAVIKPRHIEPGQIGSYASPVKNAALAVKRAVQNAATIGSI